MTVSEWFGVAYREYIVHSAFKDRHKVRVSELLWIYKVDIPAYIWLSKIACLSDISGRYARVSRGNGSGGILSGGNGKGQIRAPGCARCSGGRSNYFLYASRRRNPEAHSGISGF